MSKYNKQRFLGKGAFSNVYLTSYKGQPAVFKELQDVKNIKQVKNEVEILKQVSNSPNCHPTIVCLYEYSLNNNDIYLIEEYIEGEDLNQYIKQHSLSADQVIDILKQLIEAVHYLHQHQIAHRDIKLSNIMVESATEDEPTVEKKRTLPNEENEKLNVKLIDFGVSCSSDNCPNMFTGTWMYVSPDIWKLILGDQLRKVNRSQLLKLYQEGDIWAVGMIAYYLVYGVYPFKAKTMQQMKEEVYSAEPIVSESGNMLLDEIIMLSLSPDASYRANAEDLLQLIEELQ